MCIHSQVFLFFWLFFGGGVVCPVNYYWSYSLSSSKINIACIFVFFGLSSSWHWAYILSLLMFQAANYLNIKSLLDLTCQTVADMIKGKTPEEIRKTFNIKNDFTPEEEEEVRRENQWAFEWMTALLALGWRVFFRNVYSFGSSMLISGVAPCFGHY